MSSISQRPALDFQRIFESIPGLYLLMEPDLTMVTASDAYLKATMTTREQLIGRNVFEVFPDNPDDPKATGTSNLRASLNRVLKERVADTMAVQQYDIRRPESEGGGFEVRYWSPVNSPLFDSEGNLTHIIHRVEDVTEFIRLKQLHGEESRLTEAREQRSSKLEAEIYHRAKEIQESKKRLEHLNEKLRLSEELNRSLVQTVQEYAIFLLDTEGHIQTWNTGARRINGYEAGEIIGQHFSRFYTAEDLQDGKPARELKIAIKTGQYTEEGWRMRKDGTRYWASVFITCLRDGEGKHIGFSKIVRDQSDRKRAEDAIAELNKTLQLGNTQLEATNKELEAFSYSVSHDLRSPLRSLDGFSQALLEDYGDKIDAEGQDHLRRIRSASQRMGILIDDLLNLSRVTRSEMKREKINFSGLAKEIADEVKNGDASRVAEIVIEGGLEVEADARLLRVALTNLLNNAWKFTGKQPRTRIEVGRIENKEEDCYFVRDNGVGFDMAYAHKLFGAFQRLHGTNEFPGTGIGLATVQRVVLRHGGRIWAESGVGKGATFYFSL